MPSDLYQEIQKTRDEWEEARKKAREAMDRKAARELVDARKSLYRAMKKMEDTRKRANGTIPSELRCREVEAYKRLLKLEKKYDQENPNTPELRYQGTNGCQI